MTFHISHSPYPSVYQISLSISFFLHHSLSLSLYRPSLFPQFSSLCVCMCVSPSLLVSLSVNSLSPFMSLLYHSFSLFLSSPLPSLLVPISLLIFPPSPIALFISLSHYLSPLCHLPIILSLYLSLTSPSSISTSFNIILYIALSLHPYYAPFPYYPSPMLSFSHSQSISLYPSLSVPHILHSLSHLPIHPSLFLYLSLTHRSSFSPSFSLTLHPFLSFHPASYLSPSPYTSISS